MRLSTDETRALGFVALVLVLAGAARLFERPPELAGVAEATVDVAELGRESREELVEERHRDRPLAPGERIDPNRASAVQLDRLPQIGRALAARIVASRERDGPFAGPADLARVAGIGEATVEILRPHLRFPRGAAGRGGTHAPLAPNSVLRESSSAAGGGGASATIALNSASAAELERLPGIGPVLAGRIVAYRDSVGRFAAIDELERVPGIGPATLEALRPRLRFAP